MDARFREHDDKGASASMRSGDDLASSGDRAAFLRVDVERLGAAVDDVAAEHDLLDAGHPGQLEHRLEEESLHDRAQAARAGGIA